VSALLGSLPVENKETLGDVGWERNSRESTMVLGLGMQGVPWDRAWWGRAAGWALGMGTGSSKQLVN